MDTLVKALAQLPSDLHWNWTQVGTGEQSEEIKSLANELGVAGNISFKGSMSQAEVIEEYHAADMFVLPCRIAKSGDRDGLPNVLVEAQSQGLMVISTPISGVPELVKHDHNGILVEPDDVEALANAIIRASNNPNERQQMGKTGADIVHSQFEHNASMEPLTEYLLDSLNR